MALLIRIPRLFRNVIYNRKFIFSKQPRYCTKSNIIQEDKPPASLPDFSIPAYIPRGPTDILRALASTIKRDATASHYTFHDDPFLIPPNTVSVRNYALSKDSGRRAARYFLEKFPDEFETDDSQPKIPDFYPRTEITKDSHVTEESLLDLVRTLQVTKALQAYAILKGRNVVIAHETACSLLELLSFYNNNEPKEARYLDQKFFEPDMDEKKNADKMSAWIDNGPAEKLFEEMQVKDARAYHAIILGMCKHLEAGKAHQLFAEMKESNLPSSTKIYNGLIRLVAFTWDETGAKWAKVLNYLKDMAEEGLQPDLETFHNTLFMLTKSKSREMKDRALSVLAEMKNAGVEPSLATFHYVLSLFCSSTGLINFILHDILDEIEYKEWILKDQNDFSFFTSAMAVSAVHLRDPQIAHRVHAMLCRGGNLKFLEDRLREKSYYTHYMRLLCATEDLDQFFVIYDQCVPSVYMPEPNLMEELIKTVNVQGEIRFLPRIWTDIVQYHMFHKPIIAHELLSLVAVVGTQKDTEIQRQLLEIVWDLWERLEKRKVDRPFLRYKFVWTPEMLENLMTVLVRGGEMDKAWTVTSALLSPDEYIENPRASGKALMSFCGRALGEENRERALKVLKYALDQSMVEVSEFLEKHKDKIPEDFLENYKHIIEKKESPKGDKFQD